MKQLYLVTIYKKDNPEPTILEMNVLNLEELFSFVQDHMGSEDDPLDCFAVDEIGKCVLDRSFRPLSG